MVAALKINLHWSGLGEEGQTGCYVSATGFTGSQAKVEEVAAAVRDSIAADSYLAQLKSMLSTDQKYDKVTAYFYGDANLKADFGAEAPFAAGGIVGSGAGFLPLQNSLCVTLHTAHSGASFRGRMYFPMTGGDPGAGHQYSSGLVTAVAEMVAGTTTTDSILFDFARAVDAAGDGGAFPAIYSRAKGLLTPITAVSVDSVPDTQRRRRGSLVALATATQPYTPDV